jgi:hypothetical protein
MRGVVNLDVPPSFSRATLMKSVRCFFDGPCIIEDLIMTSETIELVERVRQRLDHQENPVRIAGPVSESAITQAEEALECQFPPSYRAFLRTWGGISLPTHLGIVHDFVGVAPGDGDRDVVARTLRAREERKLGENLVVVGMGAQHQEWFCPTSRASSRTANTR